MHSAHAARAADPRHPDKRHPRRKIVAKRRNKGEEKQTARKRIAILLRTARAEALGPDKDLAHAHGGLALRVARRYQVPLHADQKAQVCRKCGAYRTHDACRVRLRAGRITTTCLACGHVHRRPLHHARATGSAPAPALASAPASVGSNKPQSASNPSIPAPTPEASS